MGFSYQKNFFNPTLPVDEAQFWALVKATKWNEAIDKFRESGDQKLKRGLPAFIFQATFDETESKKGVVGAWRKQSATRLTGLVVMDIDHVDNPREVFESWGLAPMSSRLSEASLPSSRLSEAHGEISPLTTFGRDDKKEGPLGMTNQILLVYITPSGKGLKIVFKADVKKGNLIDNQHAMAEVLGVEVLYVKNLTFYSLTKNCLPMRTKNLVINMSLSIVLIIVALLRLLLWPLRQLNKGLAKSGQWTLGKWRTTM